MSSLWDYFFGLSASFGLSWAPLALSWALFELSWMFWVAFVDLFGSPCTIWDAFGEHFRGLGHPLGPFKLIIYVQVFVYFGLWDLSQDVFWMVFGWYVMLCYVMLCCAMVWYGMLCYVMVCYVMLCYAMLW